MITASDGGHADAALVRRFRQARTERERTAVFADVVRQHGGAVLGCCAERLWPDADAAVAAACDVLVAARLVMADSAKLARPDRLRAWLLGIAATDGLTSGLPARIDDINWEAVHAHVAADVPEMWDSPARRASLRHWLEQIVATLPEPRQRLFDLFVARGLDSRSTALELGTNVAEVRRLRRENRQAILRAFEVTALAAAEAALDPPTSDAPGCWELRQILADAQHGGDPQEGGRRHIVVLPAALRLPLTRHLSQCGTCQGRRDDCMARWAPELLPILAGTELNEQVMEDLYRVPEHARPRGTPGAHRRVARVGTTGTAVVRQPAVAAGAGLVVALLLLAFAWPGFLHSTVAFVPQGSTAPSSQGSSSGGLSGAAQQVTGTSNGVLGNNDRRQVRPGAAGLLNSVPPEATGSVAVPSSSASPTPPMQHAVQPSTSTPAAQPTSEPSPTSSPAAPSPSPPAPQPAEVPATPPPTTPPPSTPSATSPYPSTPPSTSPPPSTPPPTSPSPSTPSPSPSAPQPAEAPATPPPTTPPSTPSATSPAPSTPPPSPSPSAPQPTEAPATSPPTTPPPSEPSPSAPASSTAPPTPAPSTPAPS